MRNHKQAKSDSGQKKQTWNLEGMDDFQGGIETIGNDQSNVESLAGQCTEFTAAGDKKWPWPHGSRCRSLFVTLLGNVVDKPDDLATYLIDQAQQQAPAAAVVKYEGVSIELSADTFFFIRRHSAGSPS